MLLNVRRYKSNVFFFKINTLRSIIVSRLNNVFFLQSYFVVFDTWKEDVEDLEDEEENSILDCVANDVADSCMNDDLDMDWDSDFIEVAILDDAVALLEDLTRPDPSALVEDAKSVLAIAADCSAHCTDLGPFMSSIFGSWNFSKLIWGRGLARALLLCAPSTKVTSGFSSLLSSEDDRVKNVIFLVLT